jgi:hypothetical protein
LLSAHREVSIRPRAVAQFSPEKKGEKKKYYLGKEKKKQEEKIEGRAKCQA